MWGIGVGKHREQGGSRSLHFCLGLDNVPHAVGNRFRLEQRLVPWMAGDHQSNAASTLEWALELLEVGMIEVMVKEAEDGMKTLDAAEDAAEEA